MIRFGADLDQLNKIRRGLSTEIIAANSNERISDNDFSQRVQCRFPTRDDRDLGFKKKIELAGERRFRAARAFGDSLNATQRFGAPGDN